MPAFLQQPAGVNPDDLPAIRKVAERIREHLESLPIPEGIKTVVAEAWRHTGEGKACSNTTAEDLPGVSFAGQQETYLNVTGQEELLQAVRRCWASLFTGRAIAYRARNGFAHDSVFLFVMVQEMVFPEVSGIMFTADPVSGNRNVVSIDAGFGLGEGLVSGLVSADLYQVLGGVIFGKKVNLTPGLVPGVRFTKKQPVINRKQPRPTKLTESNDSASLNNNLCTPEGLVTVFFLRLLS